MTLEQMCADIEWSKKLVPLFLYARYYWMRMEGKVCWYLSNSFEWQEHCNGEYYPALFTEMLIEKLPPYIDSSDKFAMLTISPAFPGFFVEYKERYGSSYKRFADCKLSNALAAMLAWCVEEGVVG